MSWGEGRGGGVEGGRGGGGVNIGVEGCYEQVPLSVIDIRYRSVACGIINSKIIT